jgi:hypothetical protein
MTDMVSKALVVILNVKKKRHWLFQIQLSMAFVIGAAEI